MASRHHSLDYSEVRDVTQLLEDFEQHNSIRITLTVETLHTSAGPTIALGAIAYDRENDNGEAKPLAYVSVKCSALNLRRWTAAITHVLYVLDAQLARNEMSPGVKNK